jgi:hypothetical protein
VALASAAVMLAGETGLAEPGIAALAIRNRSLAQGSVHAGKS